MAESIQTKPCAACAPATRGVGTQRSSCLAKRASTASLVADAAVARSVGVEGSTFGCKRPPRRRVALPTHVSSAKCTERAGALRMHFSTFSTVSGKKLTAGVREVNGLRANGLAGVLGVLGVLGVRKALGECATMFSKLCEAFAKKRMETAMFSY